MICEVRASIEFRVIDARQSATSRGEGEQAKKKPGVVDVLGKVASHPGFVGLVKNLWQEATR